MTSGRRAESTVRVDSKRRIVLPKELNISEYYAVEVTPNEEIILRPRVLMDPREAISKRTLEILHSSMTNLQRGRAGEPVDLSAANDEEKVETSTIRSKRRR
jgi:hypothetical protein